MMHFKGYECNYNDHPTWAVYELVAKNYGRGKIDNFLPKLFGRQHRTMSTFHDRCLYRIGPWAIFSITLWLEMDLHVTTYDIWSTTAHFLSN